jgi:hypothetical protein
MALLAGIVTPARGATVKGEWQQADRGAAQDDNFGFSLSRAGDFDADGFTDLVVGIIFDDTLAEAAGRAVILFGGPDAGMRAPLQLLGDAAAHDQFGVSVAGGEDLDGDGHDDVAVSARFNDRAAPDGGAVFVFFGGPAADGNADLILAGSRSDDWFGQSIALVPNVDGDGHAGLLVGAPYNDDNGNASGRATLHLGGPGMDGVADLLVYGDTQDDGHFGWSVASAGDVDGDGSGDWIVGARLYGTGLDRARGRAYVFLGGPDADGAADRVYTGERRDDWFGNTVAGVGDVDGDGFDEVAVGAIFWDRIDGFDVASAAGRTYVFPGGPAFDPAPLATVEGEDMDDHLGASIAGPVTAPGAAGALWVTGAPLGDAPGAPAAGEVRLWRLLRRGSPRAVLVSRGDAGDDQWGQAVAALPGLAGSGAFYAASAPFHDTPAAAAGLVERAAATCVVPLPAATGEVDWLACASFGRFDLYTGDLTGGVAGLGCVDSGGAPPLISPALPSLGEAVLILVVGRDPAGRPGAGGYTSSGEPRSPGGSCAP